MSTKKEDTEDKVMADYPWDQCIADQTKKYGSKERAAKICGAIKARNASEAFADLSEAKAYADSFCEKMLADEDSDEEDKKLSDDEKAAKQKWISDKIATIMKDGIKGKKVDQAQAAAVAYSMWKAQHADSSTGTVSGMTIGDVSPKPLLAESTNVLKDIPLLRVGPTRNIDPDTGKPITITQEQYNQVLKSYNASELHKAPIVREALPHQEKNRKPEGFIDSVYEKPVKYPSGKVVNWIYGKPVPVNPTDPSNVAHLKNLLENELPHNSPELAPGEAIPAAVDFYKNTKHWPNGSDGYYLKAVTALGTVAPAQFGQSGALLSDDEGPFITLSLADSEEEDVAKKQIKCSACKHFASEEDKKCPNCGAKMPVEGSPEEEKMETKEEEKKEKDLAMGRINPDVNYLAEVADMKAEAIASKAKVSELEVQLAELKAQQAKERLKMAEAAVLHEYQGYLEKGLITAAEFPALVGAVVESKLADRTITLAEGKTSSLEKILRDHFAQQPPIVTGGRLHVINQDGVITLSEDMKVYQEELDKVNAANPRGAQDNVKKAIDLAEKRLGHKIEKVSFGN